MQQYFLKSLVGLFLMVTTCHFPPVHALYYRRDLSQNEADVLDRQALVETNIDPANQLEDSYPDQVVKRPPGHVKVVIGRYVSAELKSPPVVEIEEGESYEFRCEVKSNPRPQVYWIHGENPLSQVEQLMKTSVPSKVFGYDNFSLTAIESKYVIDCASKNDEGRISCLAIAGQKLSYRSTKIIVKENNNRVDIACKEQRAPEIVERTVSVFTDQGSTAVLNCQARGIPRPRIYWVNGDLKRIDHIQDPRFMVLPNGDLCIEKIGWEDMGDYVCVAESRSGEARSTTFLYPVKKDDDSSEDERL